MQQTPSRAARREAERSESRQKQDPGRRVPLPQGGRSGSPGQFIQDTYNELKKVVWPSRQVTTNLTIVVIVVSIAVGILLGALDWAFTHAIRLFLAP